MENQPQNMGPQTTQGSKFFSNCYAWYKANSRTIKGVGALAIGGYCLYKTGIQKSIFFLAGIVLVYTGLSVLNITQVTTLIDKLWSKIKGRSQ